MRNLGIILAGGKSSRLVPATLVTTKQLLPVYDKPLIYYPLSTLMLMGIRDICVISTPEEHDTFCKLFWYAEKELGIKVTVLVQEFPVGLPDAFRIVWKHLGNSIFDYNSHALILGDNIFYGAGFTGLLNDVQHGVANIFVHSVSEPHRFGVAEMNGNKVVALEEKPIHPKSDLAVTGLYIYPPDVYIATEALKPSSRKELEITDLNKYYLKDNRLHALRLSRGMIWFDTGTPESMLEASNFIHTIQKHQNVLVGSPHEIAIKNKWVTREGIESFLKVCEKTEYGRYLLQLYDI